MQNIYRKSEIPEHLQKYFCPAELGLEATPEEYVANMVKVFSEIWRVLKPEGTLWLNIGDLYNSGSSGGLSGSTLQGGQENQSISNRSGRKMLTNLKPKDLVGIPWMVAFALRSAGWYLRQDIIWNKPNPMPEPVIDRCTKAHEYIFLLSKSPAYYFNAEAIKTDSSRGGQKSYHDFTNPKYAAVVHERWKDQFDGRLWGTDGKANKRSVWTVATHPFKEAHFATFPPELITPCILAGCPPGGLVLDPFMGAGTTALVAAKAGRNYAGFELNLEYIKIAENRLRSELGMFYQHKNPGSSPG